MLLLCSANIFNIYSETNVLKDSEEEYVQVSQITENPEEKTSLEQSINAVENVDVENIDLAKQIDLESILNSFKDIIGSDEEDSNIESDLKTDNENSENSSEKEDAGLKDVLKGLEDLFLQEYSTSQEASPFAGFKNPYEMAERLPEECKLIVLGAYHECNSLLNNYHNLINFLFEILSGLGIKSEDLLNQLSNAQDKKKMEDFLEVLIKFNSFLNSSPILIFLQETVVTPELEESAKKIAKEFKSSLDILKTIEFDLKDFFVQEITIIINSLEALAAKQINLFVKYQQEVLKAQAQEAFKLLATAELMLEELLGKIGEEETALKRAIVFWQAKLQTFKPMKSYFEGPSMFAKAIGALVTASPVIEGGYFFYRKFIELYKTDNPNALKWSFSPKGLPLLGDWSIRLAIIPIHFLRKISQISKNGSRLDLLTDQTLVPQILHECMAIALDPNFCVRNFGWPIRAFYRMIPAFSYVGFSNLIHNFDNNGLSLLNKFMNKYDEKGILSGSFSDNRNIRRSVWFSLKDGYQTLGRHLQSQIYQKIPAEKLKKWEDYSFGLVRPELVEVVLDTAMPLLAYKNLPRIGVGVTKEDVFYPEFANVKDVLNYLNWDWNYIGKNIFDKEGNFTNLKDAEYVEGRVIGYVATSLGRYFGRVFANMAKKQLRTLFGKTIKGSGELLVKFGVLDNEYVKWHTDFLSEIKGALSILAFDPMLFPMIKQYVFPFFKAFGLLDQLKCEELERKLETRVGQDFDEDDKKSIQEDIDFIVEAIMNSITDTLIVGAGGWCGAYISWYITSYFVKKHNGSFSLKLI